MKEPKILSGTEASRMAMAPHQSSHFTSLPLCWLYDTVVKVFKIEQNQFSVSTEFPIIAFRNRLSSRLIYPASVSIPSCDRIFFSFRKHTASSNHRLLYTWWKYAGVRLTTVEKLRSGNKNWKYSPSNRNFIVFKYAETMLGMYNSEQLNS